MNIKPNDFPYPFLSAENDNYINSEFHSEILSAFLNEKTQKFEIKISVNLNNSDIEQLIIDGKISLYIHADSPRTYFDEIFPVSDEISTIMINKERVADKIELNAILIVNEPIVNYYNTQFHKDFQNITFDLEVGNLIGAAPSGDILIENEEPNNVESIFILQKLDKLKSGEMDLNYTNNVITIFLSKKDHQIFQGLQLRHDVKGSLYALVVIPALVETLNYINNNYNSEGRETFDDTDWFRSINHELEKMNIHLDNGQKIDNPLKTATQLLKYPLSDALSSLIKDGENYE